MEKALVLHSRRTVFPDGIADGGIVAENGTIREVFRGERRCGAGEEAVDASDAWLIPGLIDMHVHGGGGYDFLDGTEEALHGAAKFHLLHGTTCLLPTALTAPLAEITAIRKLIRQRKRKDDEPELPGLHLEGPFLSPAMAGAQNPEYLRKPTSAERAEWFRDSEGICRVTAAPELEGGMELGQLLKQKGILAGIGHSDADYAQACEAVQSGYSLLTHFYSAMSSLHRVGPKRVLGLVEAGYLEDALDIEIIADGVHLPPELLRMILKLKPLDKIALITDAMRGAGLPEGSRVKLGSLQNGQEVLVEGGVAVMPDRKAYAGSVATAVRCIRTVYGLGMRDMAQTVKLMSENPARMLGLSRKGALAPGKDADAAVLDKDLRIRLVLAGGNVVERDI